MSLSLPRALLRSVAAVAVLAAASPLAAADLALVLSTWDYRNLEEVRGARDLRAIADRLEEVGFDVISEYNADADEMFDSAQSFRDRAAEADRVLIVLDGHFVSSGTDAWMLARDADREVGPLTLPAQGLSLTALAEIAGEAAAGRAVVLAGRSSSLSLQDTGLRTGTQGMELPQGVTLASGSAEWMRYAIFAGLLREGVSLNEALSQLSARGFLSDSVAFTEGRGVITRPQPPVDTGAITAQAQEEGFWTAASDLGTEPALTLYLERYPRGRYVGEAKRRIAALGAEEANRWKAAEDALNLSRNDRRQVQSDLTLLGFNTRGIDGIFGQGTRTAIERWQRDRRLEVTSYLDRRQWRQLTSEAADRREDQAQEASRAEDAYWRDTGALGNEAGLTAYLERYPEGRYAADARRRLEEIRGAREDEIAREARRAWNDAREQDTLQGYEAFLSRFGNSEYADAARGRIAELREDDTDRVLESARAEEREILTNNITRLLVEQRLMGLGYKLGMADGNFTDQTRRALREYQEDRGIFASGYVTKRTAAFLLAGR
ncbi:peptidoglycan-binding domain-containing protein [Marinovum sp.]|uniref:peptidoglycan-binding domain-containing protein n=1 Tax=Marinovum sp. TaxID=2024839 RepID=UPI002B2671F1|nr:peptidoglycan-binding protein [Marinovum sp.]